MPAPKMHRSTGDVTRPMQSDEVTTDLLQQGRPAPAATTAAREGAPRVAAVGDRIGRYSLTLELGKGGMGHVFVAHDAGLDRLAAIKFISVLNTEMVKRFVAEARATARCTHPNIVAVYEIGLHRGAPYLALEHLDGPTLAELIRGDRLPLPRVIAIMTAVARALACAHSHGIVHRDLKPSNIVVLAADHAKVLDFGIAAFARDDGDEATRSRQGEITGTLRYMSPEQVQGAPVDGRTDIWAFGVVLHQLLTGVRPFDHLPEQLMRTELLALGRPVPSVARLRSDVPARLEEVVARCLQKVRDRRYDTADELLVAMQRLVGDQAACALPLWLASAPSAAEGDRVALGMVRAMAARSSEGELDLANVKIWPDGRVDLVTRPGPATGQLRSVAQLAIQALDCVSGKRSPVERRRARRMRRVLSSALLPETNPKLTARQLERRLAAVHSPRFARGSIAAVLALAMLGVAALTWSPSCRAQRTDQATPARLELLDRLESQVAALQSADDLSQANALFEGFVAEPANARLRSIAWRRRSARELAAHEPEPALVSAGKAYLTAGDEREEGLALKALIDVQLARQRWDEVDRALVELGERDGGSMAHASIAAAIATRRSLRLDVLRSPLNDAAHRLLVGLPDPGGSGPAEAIDLDGDGRDEVVLFDGEVLHALRPGGPALWRQEWSAPAAASRSPVSGRDSCATRDAAGAWFAVFNYSSTRLFRVDAMGATLALETNGTGSCTLGDLDGDGAAELYLVGDRGLTRHRMDAGGTWRATRVPLGSEVHALVAADLDGDGRSELTAAVGEWQAFDVRVLAGSELRMVDRVRLGQVLSLAVLSRGPGRLPILAARKHQSWGSTRFLPPERPTGAPDGIYALRLERGRLQIVSYSDASVGGLGAMCAADLDGDGRDEVLVNDGSLHSRTGRVVVLQLDDADQLGSVTVEGVAALSAVGSAAGGADAVLAVVAEGERESRWWLALGTTPTPPIEAAPLVPESALPAGLDAAMATTWRRGATLGRLGATASALAAFEQLAAIVPYDLQARVLGEVLNQRRRRHEPVAAVYEALAAHATPGSAHQVSALDEAVTVAIAEGEPAMATRLIDVALAADTLGAADRIRFQAARDKTASIGVPLFEGAPLDGAWRILDSIGVRRDPVTRALLIDGFGDHRLVEVELVRSRGPIELTVEATITRAEWAAGLAFALRPMAAGASPIEFQISTVGGGGSYRLFASASSDTASDWPHRAVDRPVSLRVHGVWFPDTDRVIWDFSADGVQFRRVETREVAAAATWHFEISSVMAQGTNGPSRMAMALNRVAVAGLEPASASPRTPLDLARIALANGNHDRVSTFIGRLDNHDASLVAAVRALRTGEVASAVAALVRVRGRGPISSATLRELAHLTRIGDAAYAMALRRAIGRDWKQVISHAWTSVAVQHPDAETVQRELTQNLRDVELSRSGEYPLLLLRARAHAAISELDDADADLSSLLQPAKLDAVMAVARADGYLERARIAIRRGDDDAARRDVLTALDVAPWPEAIADVVLLDPTFAALAASPGLERVHAIGRTLASPAERQQQRHR